MRQDDSTQLSWLFDDQGERLVVLTTNLLAALIVPLVIFGFWLESVQIGWRWQIIVTGLATAALARGLLRLRHPRAAVHCLLWGLWAAVSLQCLAVDGIRSPAAIAYPLIFIQAGWMLGRRSTWFMFCLTLTVVALMAAFDTRLYPAPMQHPLSSYWVSLTAVAVMCCALALHVADSSRRQYAQIAAARDELDRHLNQLQRSEDKFEKLFRLMPVPLSIAELADGRLLDANDAWLALWGYSRDEAIGHTAVELGIWVNPGERQSWIENVRQDGHLYAYQVRFQNRHGEPHDILTYLERVEYEGRDCIVVGHVDITERLRAEAAIQRLNAELEQRVAERTATLTETIETLRHTQEELIHADRLASLGAMVAGIAHELNTPIGNALTVATTLEHDTGEFASKVRDNALRRSALDRYVEDSQKASTLIARSLSRAGELIQSFKQVAVDQTSERRRLFSLPQLVEDLVETIRPTLRHSQWRIDTELPAALDMDSLPGPLGQVISNLVHNAVIHGLDATTGAAGVVSVSATLLADDTVELRVADNGRGISTEVLGRIFDPFFTTRLGQGGSGLGLHIVHRLVTTLLGGDIRVESAPDKGTLFIVTLPRVAPGH
ncbi:ATP-binding protein [Uliginosibacterium sp. H1]|uniref:ATP-binding protein n=1 Tax=Uliginosibacterium sp. H1 TaxID=3114757 RepID=UPI002E193CE8|nr:ATP-binding protein [Uliginosibacterium sp. H1]